MIWHETRFGTVLAAKGRQEIVDLNAFREHQAVLAKRVRKLHPPHIQTALKRGHELAARLAADPAMTRDALAKQAGLHPGHLTRLLRLHDLAPEIQQHIQALPPTNRRNVVTERRLRPIAKIEDPKEQLERFRSLIALPVRAQKRRLATAPRPSHLPPTHLGA